MKRNDPRRSRTHLPDGGVHPLGPGVPVERASTIPAAWYFDPGHHAAELERVFRRTWQLAGRVDQLSRRGSYFTTEVAGEPLLVTRGRGDEVRAFYNVCRHRAGVVARGEGCLATFRCAYHGWTYSNDGSLLAAPEMEGVSEFD